MRYKFDRERLDETIEEESGNCGRVVDTVNISITGFDPPRKISVIKAVRAITGLGLKEAKELVDGVPKPVCVPEREAEYVMKKLEESGAKVAWGTSVTT